MSHMQIGFTEIQLFKDEYFQSYIVDTTKKKFVNQNNTY